MNKNPYEVLGISQNATDQEVKRAYRDLAKKYHPDNYQDSPLGELATEKMKEINEAYDEIQRMRKEGTSYTQTANREYSSYNSYNSGNYTHTNFPDVRNLINSRRYDDAETILKGVPEERRDGEWYFLYGMIYYRRGFHDNASRFFTKAYEKDPSNPEFRNAYESMNRQRAYSSPEYRRTYSSNGCSSCDVCTALCCMDSCCECMGGDCIPCC